MGHDSSTPEPAAAAGPEGAEAPRPVEPAPVDIPSSDGAGAPAGAGAEAGAGAPAGAGADQGKGRLVRAIATFTLLRLGLMAVLTVALMFFMPLIVALAFAVVLQLPIAILAFPGQRRELTAALAQRRAGHHAERDRLRAELMGDDDPDR